MTDQPKQTPSTGWTFSDVFVTGVGLMLILLGCIGIVSALIPETGENLETFNGTNLAAGMSWIMLGLGLLLTYVVRIRIQFSRR